MQANEQTPSQSAILQLRDEKEIVFEAYDFLDEKRLLLAAELLEQLKEYEKLYRQFSTRRRVAEEGLKRALKRHGINGLQVYPAENGEETSLVNKRRQFMGVTLVTTQLESQSPTIQQPCCNLSPEAEECKQHFQELLSITASLSGISGNLQRLMVEYEQTERRARALENVVIPEIEETLARMSSQLEEIDQEEVIRLHQRHR